MDSRICLQDRGVGMRCMFCTFLSNEAEQSGASPAAFSCATHSIAKSGRIHPFPLCRSKSLMYTVWHRQLACSFIQANKKGKHFVSPKYTHSNTTNMRGWTAQSHLISQKRLERAEDDVHDDCPCHVTKCTELHASWDRKKLCGRTLWHYGEDEHCLSHWLWLMSHSLGCPSD